MQFPYSRSYLNNNHEQKPEYDSYDLSMKGHPHVVDAYTLNDLSRITRNFSSYGESCFVDQSQLNEVQSKNVMVGDASMVSLDDVFVNPINEDQNDENLFMSKPVHKVNDDTYNYYLRIALFMEKIKQLFGF
ncbi:hypothetical protein WA158_005604 [Blastocystis sp. Blastoise]